MGNCFILLGDSIMIHAIVSFYSNILKKNIGLEWLQNKFQKINIYFETDDLATVYQRVIKCGYKLIHKIEMRSWNQEVFRVFDPDEHTVEIGTPLWVIFK
jgi:uncharacterized glyoxalase superfamily protein PhnB